MSKVDLALKAMQDRKQANSSLYDSMMSLTLHYEEERVNETNAPIVSTEYVSKPDPSELYQAYQTGLRNNKILNVNIDKSVDLTKEEEDAIEDARRIAYIEPQSRNFSPIANGNNSDSEVVTKAENSLSSFKRKFDINIKL